MKNFRYGDNTTMQVNKCMRDWMIARAKKQRRTFDASWKKLITLKDFYCMATLGKGKTMELMKKMEMIELIRKEEGKQCQLFHHCSSARDYQVGLTDHLQDQRMYAGSFLHLQALAQFLTDNWICCRRARRSSHSCQLLIAVGEVGQVGKLAELVCRAGYMRLMTLAISSYDEMEISTADGE